MKSFAYLSLLFCLGSGDLWAGSLVPKGAFDSDIPMKVGLEPGLPFVSPGGKLGHWGVGNGGDYLRIGFARARDYAANVVLKIKPDSLHRIKQPEIRNWILRNQKFLAADILQTEHIWVAEEKPSCAWTVPPGADGKIPTSNPIQFSYPSCRTHTVSFLQAAQLLIHEATHHFNADETTADLIAIGIIDAWQSGLMDATPIGLEQAPAGTWKHAAVWTGDRMLVFNGQVDDKNNNSSAVSSYDPKTGTWEDIVAPSWYQARAEAQVIWTGSEAFIWGGFKTVGSTTSWIFDGALYNPTTKQWTQVAAPNWWAAKSNVTVRNPWQSLVWTGEKAIVWGALDKSNRSLGAIFDPQNRAWAAMNTQGQFAPIVQMGHSAVWTGKQLLVWGGLDASGAVSNKGASYDLATDSWKALSQQYAPAARAGHQGIWTGDRMVIISGGGAGTSSDITSTGGLYDPATDSWTLYRSEQMAERVGHKAVWNGEEILVVGGMTNRLITYLGEVYAFNPKTLQFRLLPGAVSPAGRQHPSIVWTGSAALVWGGYSGKSVVQRNGAVYYP